MAKQYLMYCLPMLLLLLPFYDCGYIVLAPKTFRKGSLYRVSVGIENVMNQVTVTGLLKSLPKITNKQLSAMQIISSGAYALLDFQIPSDAVETSYELTVSGSGGVVFTNTTTVERSTEDTLLLIQTDKAIYKPNQVVKIRVLGIDDNYKVANKPITVSIMDKNNNKLEEFKDKTDPTGVVQLEFPLSDEPPLGDWTIEAKMDGGSEVKKFTVDEYVLPKFEVTTQLAPNFIIYGKATELTVKVTAKYTYGKDVVGKVKVKLTSNNLISEKTIDITGSVDVVFTLEEILGSSEISNLMRGLSYYWEVKKVSISVNVTEGPTQFSITDDATAQIYTYPQKIHLEPLNKLNIYHPGLPVKIRVRVTDPVGEALPTYGMTVKVTYKNEIKDVVINGGEGSIVSFDTSNDDYSMYIYANIGKSNNKIAMQASVNFNKYSINGTTVLQVSNMDGTTSKKLDLDSEQLVNVKVKSTGPLTLMSYLLMSKGKIAESGSLDFSTNMEQTISLKVTSEMSPMATLLVYGITDGKMNEVIVDVFDLVIDNGMKNKVSLSFSATELKAGSNVGLTVTSDADSDVFVLAVDKSVKLLATGNDLTKDYVMDGFTLFTGDEKKKEINRPQIMFRKRRSISLPAYSSADADVILKAAGLTYLTDIVVAKTQFPIFPMMVDGGCPNCEVMAMAGAPGVAPPSDNFDNKQPAITGGAPTLAAVTHVRKYFPETWLWLNGHTSLNGDVTFGSKVPDTITSWEATAFSISPVNGLGLTTKPAKLNAFQLLFVSLNLPYSIRRGEDFELIVAVNNYLEQDVDVRVTLERSDDFGVLSVNSIDQEFIHEDMIENVQVKKQSAKSVSFQIQPKKLGDVLISVKAQSMNAAEADHMKKSVNVKPEGFKMVNNTVLSIDMNEMTMFEDNVNIWYPSSVVMGSKRAEVKVTGDVMGPVLENLESLLRVPTGCGEQNMLGMVPNIFVADYLTNVNKITQEIKDRAARNMKTGYQRELNYRHSDGSFSAFGDSDDSGSTWLSAFVLKSFSQASRFITIDSGIQTKTFTWLNKQLKSNGEFDEPGRVIHSDMLGGAGTGNKGLTAFVLTAMLESKDFIERSLYNSAISKTIKYLEDLVDRNSIKKPYEKAIIAYALTLANSQKAEILLKQLNDGEKPWTRPTVATTPSTVNDKGVRMMSYHPPTATASDVETWAYVLLSYAKNMDVGSSRPIVKWLMSQQNPNGGFYSTQDTVVGLQALADYGELTFSTAKDLTITVNAGNLEHVFTVNKENALIYQSFMLSPDSTDVQVTATGVGMAIVKVIWRYYSKTDVPSLLPQDGDNKAPILLSVASKKATNQKSNVVACVQCMKDIGMSLITMDMPSGHSPNNMQELRMNKLIKRTEFKDGSVHLYMDKIPQEETCFNVEIMQTQKVGNLQDVPVKAMAYYQTEIQSSVMYNVEVNSKNFCDMCKGNNCHGCPSSSASRWTTASMTAVAAICVLLSLIFSI